MSRVATLFSVEKSIPGRYIPIIIDSLDDKDKYSHVALYKAWKLLSTNSEWWRTRYRVTFGELNFTHAESSPESWIEKYAYKLSEWTDDIHRMNIVDFALKNRFDMFEKLCFARKIGKVDSINMDQLSYEIMKIVNHMLLNEYNRDILESRKHRNDIDLDIIRKQRLVFFENIDTI